MHHSIITNVGYPVTGLRAIELVIYTMGGSSADMEVKLI
jgi:hypothetical protein